MATGEEAAFLWDGSPVERPVGQESETPPVEATASTAEPKPQGGHGQQYKKRGAGKETSGVRGGEESALREAESHGQWRSHAT